MQNKIALATIIILGSAVFAATLVMSLTAQRAAASFIVCARPNDILTCVSLGPPPGIVPKVGVSIDPNGGVNVHTPNADVNIHQGR
jgi:hypothetical protein